MGANRVGEVVDSSGNGFVVVGKIRKDCEEEAEANPVSFP